MGTDLSLTSYDFIVLGLFALFIGRGIWLGFLKQVTGLLALYLGYFSASQYHDRLFPFLLDIADNPKVGFWVTYVILFVFTYVVAMLVGRGLTKVIEVTIAVWFDRFLGAILGFAKGAIIVILLHMVLGTLLAPESQIVRNCTTCESLNQATDFSLEFIKNERVRKALSQEEPAISLDKGREILEKLQKEQASPKQSPPVK
jgi:membrane protein required for colicin V production